MNKKQMIIANILICSWFIVYFAIYDFRHNIDDKSLNETNLLENVSKNYNKLNKCSSTYTNDKLTINCEEDTYVINLILDKLILKNVDDKGLSTFKDISLIYYSFEENDYADTIDKIFNFEYYDENIEIIKENELYTIKLDVNDSIKIFENDKIYKLNETVNINETKYIIEDDKLEINSIVHEYDEYSNIISFNSFFVTNNQNIKFEINFHDKSNEILISNEYYLDGISEDNSFNFGSSIALDEINYEDIKYISFNITDMN